MKKLLYFILFFSTALLSQAQPILEQHFPKSGVNSVHPATNLELIFDIPIKAGPGFIYIKDYYTDYTYFQFAVNSTFVKINHNKVTIDLSSNLPLAKKLYIQIDKKAFENLNEKTSFFAGSNNKKWNFTTASYVVESTKFYPKNEMTCVPVDTQLSIDLTQSVTIGNGLIKIINCANNKVVQMFRASNGQMKKDPNDPKKYIITLTKPLAHDTKYCVFIEPTAFYNTTGVYAGLSKSQWRFTTNRKAPHTQIVVSTQCKYTDFEVTAKTNNNAQKYFWYDQNGTLLAENGPILKVSLSESQTYYVSDVVRGCESAKKAIVLSVVPKTTNISDNQNIIEGDEVPLLATGGVSYQWSPTTGLSDASIPSPVASPEKTTTYKVLITTDKGCTFEKTVKVTVVTAESKVFLPNLFSPNDDMKNDFFRVLTDHKEKINTIDFRIYDRSGTLIYHSTDTNQALNEGWNGTANGVDQPTDTYIWYLSGTYTNGKMITFEGKNKGTIVLVR